MSIPCIICQEVFDSDTNVIALNRCGHLYHRNCLEDWKKSSPQNRATCPVCRKTYDKRSIRRLYFNVEEPEISAQLSNDLKKQKIFSENLEQNNEKLQKELTQKNMEVDKIYKAWLQAVSELNKMKTDYGIKCQAYSIIDTVNNEYIQDNLKLKGENLKLKSELAAIKQPGKQQKIVDLTCSNCESDDDIQIVNNSKKSEVIIILDDDESNDVELCPDSTNDETTKIEKKCIESSTSCCEEIIKSAKIMCENDDYQTFEDFILSQI